MILEVTYADGHHECFDSNSLTGGAVFGRANILTEFDVVWEDCEEGQHLVVYEHHMEESASSDDEASANPGSGSSTPARCRTSRACPWTAGS